MSSSPLDGGGGGGPSPSTLFERARGRSTTSILRQGVGAWLLTVSSSAILGVQAIVEFFLLTPLDIMTGVARASAQGLILEPLGLVESGADTSAQALSQFEILGLPISVILVLGTLFIVVLFLRERETSDLLPGTFTDFVGGVEEESNAED